jgi:5'-3' exonuclease
MAPPLLAADIPWLLYRSFFALPSSITDDAGRPVNALLGTVNALLLLIDNPVGAAGAPPEIAPRAVVACMGAEQAAYRVRLYEPYHAHRDPMPPALAEQWRRARELLAGLGWIYAASDDLEADDVMFSYARAESEAGGDAWLLTGDRDLYGAVDEHVSVVELRRKGEWGLIDSAEVRARYGVEPGRVPDLIALRGDPSDGLPGAPGIGAKTAAELIREHGSLEGALAAAGTAHARMRPRVASALGDNAELLRAFKQIATLQRVDVERPPDTPTDFARGAQTARAFGMKRLAARLEKLAG